MTDTKIFKSRLVNENFTDTPFDDFPTLFAYNELLKKNLIVWKNRIDNERRWDNAKKYTNKYEFIFSLNNEGVADVIPISRSYFKMIEILTDFDFKRTTPIKCACLCEGPGGFVQAINDYATTRGLLLERIECISLMSPDKKVPDWKLGSTSNYRIGYGYDGTGDIYKLNNIDHFCENTGEHSCDLVTADGGFDFSQDFNSQEKSFVRMFVAEMYMCVRLQKGDGMCVIKAFDLFRKDTISIIAILLKFYSNVDFVKPKSSRPANSEKYLVCSGFSRNDELTNRLRQLFVTGSFRYDDIVSESEYEVANRLVSVFNVKFVNNQIHNIQYTLESIQDKVHFDHKNNEKHKEACIEWCNKYKIPIKKHFTRR